ncbi:MAG TPA: hypothetical protein VK139_03625, partial [Microbacteriaceae bacterium]|nr:hypothetical protein [Microbacteriaceae bacterium]
MSVLLIRANRNEVDAEALAAFGIDCIIDPFMTITPRENDTGVARMRAALEDGEPSWLIATST